MTRSIDLDKFHDAVKLEIADNFPTVSTVEDYDTDRKDLMAPAILIELVDMEADPDSDPGTEQLAVVSKWVARIIMSFRTENVKREIRKFAAALGVLVHQNRWSMQMGPAQVTYIGPDAFSPELDKYEVWAVEWDQQIDLGQSVWTGEGVTPDRVMIGYAPKIGPGQEGDYSELGGNS
ncbi:hypothetical protein PHIN109289_05360 [Phaeobacter inhibens]|uniref:hypothetical protein n=1 Tax=Phaeobacter inhibens TaxID=221822 RepID=UPI0004280AF3|nr:hypothetical protein [Phaeobacter inhibens]